MPLLKESILARLGQQDLFEDIPIITRDVSGFNSQHHFLTKAIRELDSSEPLILEVGVWKGASVIHMAQTMKELKIQGCILACDPFNGFRDGNFHFQGKFFGGAY